MSVNPATAPFDLASTFPQPAYWPPGVERDFLLPIVLANAISYVLLGSLIVQILFYLRRYTKDKLRTRVVTWCLLLGNLAQGFCQLAKDVEVLGLGFGDWQRLGDFHSRGQDFAIPILSVLIISTSQSVIAIRSYLFCRSMSVGSASKIVLAWACLRAFLILGSLAFGIGAVVLQLQYSNLFTLIAVSHVKDIYVSSYPLCEMMWLLLGTIADLSIAWSMWSDARKAKTGSSSDSFLQLLINVALRCGVILAVIQTTLNILYFADSPAWAHAAHSILPRVSSLTVVYSITSPREAYRAFLRQKERRADNALVSFEPPSGTSITGGGTNSSGSGTRGGPSGCSRVRSIKKAVGGAMRKGGGSRLSLNGRGGRKPKRPRSVSEEEEGRIEGETRGNEDWLGGMLGAEEEEEMLEVRVVGRGGVSGGGVNVASTRSVTVQTTSKISVERIEEEGEGRLGNSVTVECCHSPPHSHHHHTGHLARLSSNSLRRDRSKQTANSSRSERPSAPSSHSDPSPNFMDSFPSRPTVTSSIGTYDEAMVDEMFDLTERK
ncbi:hypothetical protein BDY24DRAFT_391843 [Mrakia frigida]|uniref:uncharacterized protein n=1 Tax=Mrakia frigida TaxID=29902 RepID=UPI003FCC02B3